MTGSATIETEGAILAYDYEGAGPLLLTIAGGGGDAPRYAGIARQLADDYTVVRYDRRCNSRSSGDTLADLDMAQQARDAVAVIRAMGAESAFVFGNSGGANVALKIAEILPEAVTGMIVHEPPVIALLPDADDWLGFMDRVEETFRADGAGPAMRMFASSLVGFDGPLGPGHRIGGQSGDDNIGFFLAHEFHAISRFVPDIARLRSNGVPTIMVAGRASADAYYARSASVLAEALGNPYRVMCGNHIAFVSDPARFAAELRPLLDELKAMRA